MILRQLETHEPNVGVTTFGKIMVILAANRTRRPSAEDCGPRLTEPRFTPRTISWLARRRPPGMLTVTAVEPPVQLGRIEPGTIGSEKM